MVNRMASYFPLYGVGIGPSVPWGMFEWTLPAPINTSAEFELPPARVIKALFVWTKMIFADVAPSLS